MSNGLVVPPKCSCRTETYIYEFNAAQFSSRCERTIIYDDWQRHIADPVNIYILYIAYCYGWGMFYDVYFGFTTKKKNVRFGSHDPRKRRSDVIYLYE